jgi:hypothetical protein
MNHTVRPSEVDPRGVDTSAGIRRWVVDIPGRSKVQDTQAGGETRAGLDYRSMCRAVGRVKEPEQAVFRHSLREIDLASRCVGRST